MGLKRKKTESKTTLSLPYLLLLLFHLALTIPPASTTTTVAPSLLPRAVTTETATGGTVTVWPGVTQAILARDTTFSCTLILVLEAASPVASSLPQSLEASTHGAAVVMVVDKEESNLTDSLTHLLPLARQVRLRSWCTRVVVVSSDVAFLAAFARWSLRSRLLVWAARLVVLTSLKPPLLLALLPSSWTFAWMNAVFVNVQDATAGARYDVYAFLPFSPAGARVARVASWTKRGGLVQGSHLPLFPDKYSSFHGAEINVTARKYLPFWGEEEVEGATDPAAKQFYGPDYHQLKAVAQALNFTFRVVPAESWEMVEDLVESRVCLLVGVGYIVLSTRLKRHDYTITFLLDGNTFVMARPSFKSDWLAVFRPLSMHLWAGVLGSLLLVSVVLWVVS